MGKGCSRAYIDFGVKTMPDRVTYIIPSNQTEQGTLSFLAERLERMDDVKIKKVKNNTIVVKLKYGWRKVKVGFAISKQEAIATVYGGATNKVADKWWDIFLEQFLTPPTIFCNIKVANGKPEIVKAEFTSPEFRNKTTYKTDYSPTILGWKSETKVYHEKEQMWCRGAKILYSNGRYFEGVVFTGGKLEHEIYDYFRKPHDYWKEIQEFRNR